MSQTLGILLATSLTLAIFSRVWRVNAAYRSAQHLLLGAQAGYVAAVALRAALLPALAGQAAAGPAGWGMLAISLTLTLLLAFRFGGRGALRQAGLTPVGLLLGAAGALALAGALRGTLVPQALAALQLSYLPATPWADALAVILSTFATISVLAFLHLGPLPRQEERAGWLASLTTVGYWTLMIALGALLGATAGARITLLIDRLLYFLDLFAP